MFKKMLISVVAIGITMSSVCPVLAAEEMPHELKCNLSGVITSICYIRGWAGKPVEYIDEYINGNMDILRDNGIAVSKEDKKIYRDMCVTFFNQGREDDFKGVSYRQAKANESIIEQQIPVMCMKSN